MGSQQISGLCVIPNGLSPALNLYLRWCASEMSNAIVHRITRPSRDDTVCLSGWRSSKPVRNFIHVSKFDRSYVLLMYQWCSCTVTRDDYTQKIELHALWRNRSILEVLTVTIILSMLLQNQFRTPCNTHTLKAPPGTASVLSKY